MTNPKMSDVVTNEPTTLAGLSDQSLAFLEVLDTTDTSEAPTGTRKAIPVDEFAATGGVTSVNGETGPAVSLDASQVGALAFPGAVESLADSTNDHIGYFNIEDDASSTANWVDRFRLSIATRVVNWIDGLGRLNLLPQSISRAALRVYAALNSTELSSRSNANPILEIYNHAAAGGTVLLSVDKSGNLVTVGKLMGPNTPVWIVATGASTWPASMATDVPTTTPVVWVQPNAGGSQPAFGSRPNAVAGDFYMTPQA